MKVWIVTFIGSCKFRTEWYIQAEKETLRGHLVLMTHAFGEVTEEQKAMLLELDRQRIVMSDEVLVINKNGYMGTDTREMLEHVRQMNVPVRFLELDKVLEKGEQRC